MEPAADARRDGAGWSWSPQRFATAVALSASRHGGDYTLCAAGGCQPLRALVPREDAPVELRACAQPPSR
jgi:hypothetical protein